MVSLLLTLLLACAPETAPAPAAPATLRPERLEAPSATEADANVVVAAEAPPPGGVVGGMPILDRPVILGGIDNAAVEAAFDAEALGSCNNAGKPGKVLLRFRIDKGGRVVDVETKSSTLRHQATEACLQAAVKATRFPELERGESAIVTWPFSL